MCLAWDLRSGCLDVTINNGLVSADNMRGFGQDPWEKSDPEKYLSDNMREVHVQPDVRDENTVYDFDI